MSYRLSRKTSLGKWFVDGNDKSVNQTRNQSCVPEKVSKNVVRLSRSFGEYNTNFSYTSLILIRSYEYFIFGSVSSRATSELFRALRNSWTSGVEFWIYVLIILPPSSYRLCSSIRLRNCTIQVQFTLAMHWQFPLNISRYISNHMGIKARFPLDQTISSLVTFELFRALRNNRATDVEL